MDLILLLSLKGLYLQSCKLKIIPLNNLKSDFLSLCKLIFSNYRSFSGNKKILQHFVLSGVLIK